MAMLNRKWLADCLAALGIHVLRAQAAESIDIEEQVEQAPRRAPCDRHDVSRRCWVLAEWGKCIVPSTRG
jgi:hypothetical protein